jgi:hypothetical protein
MNFKKIVEALYESVEHIWGILSFTTKIISVIAVLLAFLWSFLYITDVNFFPNTLLPNLNSIVSLTVFGVSILAIFILLPTFSTAFLLFAKENKNQADTQTRTIGRKKSNKAAYPWKIFVFYVFLLLIPFLISFSDKPLDKFLSIVIISTLFAILVFPYFLIPRFCSNSRNHRVLFNLRAWATFTNFLLFLVYLLFGWKFASQFKGFGVYIIALMSSFSSIFYACLQIKLLANGFSFPSNEVVDTSKIKELIVKIFAVNTFIFFVGTILFISIGSEDAIYFPFQKSGIGAKYVVVKTRRNFETKIYAYFSPWTTTQKIAIDVMNPCKCDNTTIRFQEKKEKNKNIKLKSHVYEVLTIDSVAHGDKVWYFNTLEDCSNFCSFLIKKNPKYRLYISPVLTFFLQPKAKPQSSESQQTLKSGHQNQTPAQKRLKCPQEKQEKQVHHN